jgi:SagB-type dehydrogenase family enzyme
VLTEWCSYKCSEQCLLVVIVAIMALFGGEACMAEKDIYRLPEAGLGADACLIPVLQQRRTNRAFASRPVSLADVAQLLWAAQGITSHEGYRTAPSAGALYPLELHLVSGRIDGLPAGSYRYDPVRHALRVETTDDLRQAVAGAALDQDWIAQAPAIVVVSAVDSRTTRKYGPRGIRYVHMEVGHAGQNLLLQAVALGLAGATVGAFDDERLQQLLKLPEEERPLLILPVGHAR